MIGQKLTDWARKRVKASGAVILPQSEHRRLYQRALDADKLALLAGVTASDLAVAVASLRASPSQLGQDLFALRQAGWKRDGFFVEFGATDGHTLSNSWLLETQFGWRGILAEPARGWHRKLAESGRTAAVEHDCVWDKTGETLTFHETPFRELSTAGEYVASDFHERGEAERYEVATISLNDLLEKHGAPRDMDFLSIDTEGSELRILRSLDFNRWRFATITCEHNFTEDREAIRTLLASKGYTRAMEDLSRWDDWYVLKSAYRT